MSPRPRWLPSWLRGRRMLFVLIVAGVVQIPGVPAVAHFSGSWLLAIAGALGVSLPFLASLRTPVDDKPSRPLPRYRSVWPFYTWWASCMTLALAAPLCFA